MHQHGLGCKKNYQKAVEFYKLSAEQGDMHSRYALAHMYEKGLGVEKDQMEAIKIVKLVVDQGYVKGREYFKSLFGDMIKDDQLFDEVLIGKVYKKYLMHDVLLEKNKQLEVKVESLREEKKIDF